jgi:hypothetical protein
MADYPISVPLASVTTPLGMTMRQYTAITLMPEMLRYYNAGDNIRAAELAANAAMMAAGVLCDKLEAESRASMRESDVAG